MGKLDICNMFPISEIDYQTNNNKIYIKDLLCAGHCYIYHRD